jgi:hypothetical protein
LPLSFFIESFLQSSFFLWSQAGQVVGVAVGIVEELATRGSLVAAGWTIRNDSRRSRPSRNLRNLMGICLFLSGGRSAIPLSSGPEEDEDPVDCHFNSMSFLQQLSDLAIRNGRALSPQLNNLLLEGASLDRNGKPLIPSSFHYNFTTATLLSPGTGERVVKKP